MNHPRVDVTHPAFTETSAGRALLAGYGARRIEPPRATRPRAILSTGRNVLMAGCITVAAALAAGLAVTLM